MIANVRVALVTTVVLLAGTMPGMSGESSIDADSSMDQVLATDHQEGTSRRASPGEEYAELIVLGPEQLKEKVLELSPASQYEFWVRHIESFLRTDIGDEKRAALERLLDALDPGLFERAKREGARAVRDELIELQRLLSPSFSPTERRVILSPQFQRAGTPVAEVLREMPPETQCNFWRTHLRSFLSADLSPEERQALQYAVDSLTPELFARARAEGFESVRQRVEHLRETLSREFSSIEVAAMLSPSTNEGLMMMIAAQEADDCTCATRALDECGGGDLVICVEPPNEECTDTSWGCGPMWLMGCDGMCCLRGPSGLHCPWD